MISNLFGLGYDTSDGEAPLLEQCGVLLLHHSDPKGPIYCSDRST